MHACRCTEIATMFSGIGEGTISGMSVESMRIHIAKAIEHMVSVADARTAREFILFLQMNGKYTECCELASFVLFKRAYPGVLLSVWNNWGWREVFLGCVLITQKLYDDISLTTSSFAELWSMYCQSTDERAMTFEELKRLEGALCNILQWRVHVGEKELAHARDVLVPPPPPAPLLPPLTLSPLALSPLGVPPLELPPLKVSKKRKRVATSTLLFDQVAIVSPVALSRLSFNA